MCFLPGVIHSSLGKIHVVLWVFYSLVLARERAPARLVPSRDGLLGDFCYVLTVRARCVSNIPRDISFLSSPGI